MYIVFWQPDDMAPKEEEGGAMKEMHQYLVSIFLISASTLGCVSHRHIYKRILLLLEQISDFTL